MQHTNATLPGTVSTDCVNASRGLFEAVNRRDTVSTDHFNLCQQHIDTSSANNAKDRFNEILQLHSRLHVQHLKNSSSAVPVFCTVALN